MNRSLETVHAPTETARKRTSLEEAREQFDRAATLLHSPMREHRVARVDSRMRITFGDLHEPAERDQISLRDAGYLIAVERVARACRERGWV